MSNILVFGASTTYGAWDIEGGWVGRLRKYIDKKVIASYDGKNHLYHHIVYNLGVDGDDSRGILGRFEAESALRVRGEEVVVLLHLGINDSQFKHKEQSFRVPPDEFMGNLEKILKMAKKLTDRVYFVGLQAVDDKKTDPIPWNTNESYLLENVEKYDQMIQEVCQAQGVEYIEVLSKFKNADLDTVLEDGLHPNEKGHELTFVAVRDFLVEKGAI